MWRAYTREKPARQGLALIIVAVSSALVAAMAGSVIRHKSAPLLAIAEAAPANWPISFKLPADFEETTAIRASQLDSGLVAATRRVIFKNRTDASKRIGVGYRASHEVNEIMDATLDFVERAASDGKEAREQIEIPTADPNWMVMRRLRPDSVTYLATLIMPDRSVVRIAYATASPSARDRRLLVAICDSVAVNADARDADDDR